MTRTHPSGPISACFPPRPLIRLSLGIAAALGMATAALPAKARPKQAQETVVRLNGSSTIGSKMALGLAMAWAKQLKLSGVHVEAGLDPDEYDVVTEGAGSTHKMRVQVRSANVRAFETATAGADRLTITFRFQAGTNNLDSRAEADLKSSYRVNATAASYPVRADTDRL